MKAVYSKTEIFNVNTVDRLGLLFLEITYKSPKKQTGSILILSQGQLVKEEIRGIQEGWNVFRINCSSLESGYYNLSLMTPEAIIERVVNI